MDSFDTFCAAEATRQRRKGLEVPVEKNSFSYFQWLASEKVAFDSKKSRGKRPRDGVKEVLKPLVDNISSDIAFQLKVQHQSSCPPELTLAKRAVFPSIPSDLSPMLCSIELILRLSFVVRSNPILTHLARRCVAMSGGQLKDIVSFEREKFPSIFVLLNLSAMLSLIELDWEQIGIHKKKELVVSLKKFCKFIDCPQSRDLEAVLLAEPNEDLTDEIKPQFLQLMRDLACALPFDFPEECSCVLQEALGPQYRAPGAKLLLKGSLEAPRTPSPSNAASKGPGSLKTPTQRPTNPENDGVQRSENTKKVEPPLSIPESTTSVTPSVSPSSKVECVSKYHSSYGKGHASSKCKFCTVCHMMEVIFNGCTTDCAWKHWPSEKKLKYHLSSNPKVLKVAHERFFKLSQGARLDPYPDI